MGKPSSTHLSRNSSTHSIKSNMSKEKMTTISKRDRLRKRHLKQQRSIHKLFNQLRDTSHNSQNSSQTSFDNSIIDLEDPSTSLIQNNLGTINEVSIVIPDDEQKASSTPKKFSLHTSTPKRSSKLEDVILSSSNNNLQNSVDRNTLHTIDLTGFNSTQNEPTVIDLVDTTDDVTVVSPSNASSMSGDSQVTVLNQPVSRKLRKFNHKIQNLNAADKGKLLELITETIFNGCTVTNSAQSSVPNVQKALPRAQETAEDTYIKEVILGGNASRSSIGSNVYHPDRKRHRRSAGKRMVVIDGSNVAMQHGRGKLFSVRGLQICIDYFLRRGHVVKAFVPRFRCKYGMSSDPRLLDYLERKGLVIYTPSREVKGRTITPYDDRYIVQCAAEFDAVIVSGDNYRDIANENPRWRSVIETRLLPFTWVEDMVMFPKDPLGRHGPTLERFLSHP